MGKKLIESDWKKYKVHNLGSKTGWVSAKIHQPLLNNWKLMKIIGQGILNETKQIDQNYLKSLMSDCQQ